MKPEEVYHLQDNLSQIEPLNGSLWRHYKGDVYKVVLKTIESDEPHRVMVHYRSELHGYLWTHTLDEWNKLFQTGDLTTKRFTPVVEDIIYSLEEHWD